MVLSFKVERNAALLSSMAMWGLEEDPNESFLEWLKIAAEL
jgi:hypothetical protein